MADITFLVTDCVPGTDVVIEHGWRGTTANIGDAVYRDSATNTWKQADNNSTTAEARQATGIAINTGRTGHPITVARSGTLTCASAPLTAGTAYYLSDTPGAICPIADVGSGEYVCLVGIAKSTTELVLSFQYPNVAL